MEWNNKHPALSYKNSNIKPYMTYIVYLIIYYI